MSLVPQLGLPELLVLAVLVLLVVGPKDLPKFLYGAGQMVGKARRLADEFRAGLSQMAREAEMEEMRQEIENLKKASPTEQIKSAMRDLEDDVRSATVPAAPSQAAPHTDEDELDHLHDDDEDDLTDPEASAEDGEEKASSHG
ncbi:Sec-independent protein translocase protein TatB [Parvularcula maris]|uniref:Sec-independent protein translocase protein TatB n=1 Tax=Parvularcula maris TaxID=2965077 RepID=A0A9X2L7W1_9PROT|nr:Sec-independent protein translocase protein TatB [Parvularcula maris]MCQ8184554.1 Sec-independent protein translocase protein TatB [Parvularcula maris]